MISTSIEAGMLITTSPSPPTCRQPTGASDLALRAGQDRDTRDRRSARVPHHENVDSILALHDEAMALVKSLSTAPLQDVQPKRAVGLACAELLPQDERSDPPSLAIGPEIEVLNPQRAFIRAYRNGARLLATDQHDLGYHRVERRQE